MADKQLVPFNEKSKQVVPFTKKPKPLAALSPDHNPLPYVPPRRPHSPPPPQGRKQVMYAQPYDRRREAALKKPIHVPSYMDIQEPKKGERLTRVRMDANGNTREHKYTTAPLRRTTIDGIRAKESQIKRISIIEASHRMPQKKKTRKTVADLAQDVAALAETCKELHRVNSSLTSSVLQLLDERKKRRENEEEDASRNLKKGKGPK